MSRRIVEVIAGITGVLVLAGVSSGGDLTPPPGPVQATDRIPLNEQSIDLPYVIDQPGSYVLTSDLRGITGEDGIILETGGVTIDLNGFSLVGVLGAGSAITVSSPTVGGVRVMNGLIGGWSGGIALFGPENVVENVVVNGCTAFGIIVGVASRVTDSTAYRNGGLGIGADSGSIVARCVAMENTPFTPVRDGESAEFPEFLPRMERGVGGGGFILVASSAIDCRARGNVLAGFRLVANASATNCAAELTGFPDGGPARGGPLIQGDGFDAADGDATITNCQSNINEGNGFRVGARTSLRDCQANSNGENGFYFEGVGVTMRACDATDNAASGFLTPPPPPVAFDRSEHESGRGIPGKLEFGFECVIDRCTAQSNGEAGFSLGGAFNLLIRNKATANANNYLNTGNSNRIGLIANLFPSAAAENPWANFAF